jgi:hypothetical protein
MHMLVHAKARNNISDIGAVAMVEALKQNRYLVAIRLGDFNMRT